MRYLIYVRISNEKQDTEIQIDNCNKYVDSIMKSGDVKITLCEAPMSTRIKAEKRPTLQYLLSTCKKNDMVVVASLSRIARCTNEMVQCCYTIMDSGAVLYSLAQQFVERKMIGIFGSVAHFERDNISWNTVQGLKAKRNRGEMTGTPPYGWQLDKNSVQTKPNVRSTGKPFLLIPQPQEQAVVQMVMDMNARGLSHRDISKELTALGKVNRAGNPFQHMAVYRIVQRQQLDGKDLVTNEVAV